MSPPLTLLHLIDMAAQARPDAPALGDGTSDLSYAQLRQQVRTTAAGLQSLGLQAGERVAIYLPKQSEAVVALLAAACSGGVFVPINPLLKAAQVAHILRDSGASLLVTSADRASLLSDVMPTDLRHLIITDSRKAASASPGRHVSHWQMLQSNTVFAPTDITENSNAAILYTSGSSGPPKGVLLTHRNLLLGAQSVVQYLGIDASDRILAVLPLSFDYGLNQLLSAFQARASVILLNYLLPRDVLHAVMRERITVLAGVPSLWVQLAELDWPVDAPLRTLTNSGGHLPVPVIQRLRQRLPEARLFLMYGLTEAFRSSYLPPAELDARPTSMGRAIPYAELAVVRPDGTACDPDEPGELVHAGPLVSMGYWNNPTATSRHFRAPPPALAHLDPAEKVLWSGDTVVQDADGYLYFVGRKDAMIKTSGYRVSPSEVEAVLHDSGLVAEAAVCGIPHPKLGEAIVAIVTPAAGGELRTQALLDHCRRTLPAYMVPVHIEQRSRLPKTPHGKIDRQQLKKALSQYFAEAS